MKKVLAQSPATMGLVMSLAAAFLAAWLMANGQTMESLAFLAAPLRLWTFLTYPLAFPPGGGGFLYLVLECFWLFMIGTQLERWLRPAGLLVSFFGYAALSAALAWLVHLTSGADFVLSGPLLPVASLTCVWAGRNPDSPILLFGIIPLAAKWIALLLALGALFAYGIGAPAVGVAVALPCLLAWFQGRRRVSLFERQKTVVTGRGQRAKSETEFDAFMKKVKDKEKERDEREKLRKLLESGTEDGPQDR